MTNVVDRPISLMEPTADLSNIYLAWWDRYLYNKWLALSTTFKEYTGVIPENIMSKYTHEVPEYFEIKN